VREFEWPFEEGLRKGLRNEEFSPAREQQLVECWNLRPRQTGLLPVVSITNPFAQTINWPFPQVLVGRNFRVLADEITVYTCDDSWATTSRAGGILAGDCWDWAEFGDYLLMANGERMVRRTGGGVWSSATSWTDIPGMKTVCQFKGRAVGGNITTAWYDCGENYVVWSDIGSAVFTPDQKNTAGYAIVPYHGAVLRVLPLGDILLVYCENGVMAMKPSQQYFAMAELLPVGIPWKGAVGGGSSGHVFIDYNGELWKVEPGPKVKKLGYQEYMTQLTAGDIMVSYNAGEDEYYISDGSLTFLLTPFGLCQTYQLPTSLAFVDGQLVGVNSNGSDVEGRAVTDLVDFGIRSFKTVSVLEVGGFSSAGFRACVDWRSDNSGSFQRSTWLVSNPTGFVTPIVTANDFRLCVKSSSFSDMELRYIIARVKNVDRRAMRGVPVSGAGLRR